MTDSAAEGPASTGSSFFEDLIDILYAPSKVFARQQKRSAWPPFLVVAVLIGVLSYVNVGNLQGVLDAEINRAVAEAMEKNPSMNEEALTGMRRVMETSMTWGTVLGAPLLLCVLGLVVWIVGKALGGTLGFGTGILIASFAYVPRILESALVAVQGLVLDTASYTSRFQFSFGIGRLMDPNGPQGMLNLLGRIDVFTLWVTLLLAIGLQYTAKVSKEKAYVGAVTLWVLGALPAVWQVAQGK